MTSAQLERMEEKRSIRLEAIAALKEAEEAFDQACAVLKDAGMYNDGVRMASGYWPAFDAEDLNMKLIPALINHLERGIADYEEEN
jgi:hypothetical protein